MTENVLQSVLSKKVDRKEFLLYLGTFLLTLVGITGMIKSLSAISTSGKKQKGFGGGPYGK